MNEVPLRPRSTFPATAREHVRTALELASRRTSENAARVAAELTSLASEADTLGLAAIADLARRGTEQARLMDREHAAVSACARTLRELARAVDALERAPAAPRPRRVLIVDDSSLNASVVCDALERASFEARCVEDASSAVEAVARFAPDVVLVDVHMPDTTPGDLCTRLRAAAGSRALQLVLFSGLTDDELVEIERETKADGYVSKESGLDAVVDEVGRAFRRMR